jgi:hypothetical protein
MNPPPRILRATAACVYFPKYSNIVRKNLSTAQFGFLQFFMGHDTRVIIKNMFRLIACWFGMIQIAGKPEIH